MTGLFEDTRESKTDDLVMFTAIFIASFGIIQLFCLYQLAKTAAWILRDVMRLGARKGSEFDAE